VTNHHYLLDNASTAAGARFRALAAVFDGWTFHHVEALGLRPGAACWEVGAGGSSVPTWLAAHVGDDGDVLATDIDVSWMPDDRTYRVLLHDVAGDEPPGSCFDLVHARLVLTHVPGRDEALRRVAAALRPGGWLLVEDFDVALQPYACLDGARVEHERANEIRAAFEGLLEQRGVDLAFGRTLPERLRTLGLVDVGADAYFPIAAPAARALEQANVTQLRSALTATGVADTDLESHLEALAAGTIDVAMPPLVSAWARKPPHPPRR
jgi:SAM-dependent methyltransferase